MPKFLKGYKGRPVILVDMDGVIASYDQGIIDQLTNRYPDIPILKTRKNWYISDDYPEHSRLLRDLYDEPGFFENLPLIDHALEGWQRLIDLGYHPVICSAPQQSNPRCKIEKLNWLKREFVPEFGELIVDQAIIDKNKHLHGSFAIIEDNPKVPNADLALWKQILFNQPYNQNSQIELRMYGWLDKKLPELLTKIADISSMSQMY